VVVASQPHGAPSSMGPVSIMLLAGVIIVWGVNYPVTRYALTHGFSPLAFVAARFAIASGTFGVIASARERTLRIERRHVRLLVLCATVGIFVNQVAFVYAVKLTSASSVALFFGTVPVFVALFSHLSGIEVISRRRWIATAVSGLGAALVAFGASRPLLANAGGVCLAIAAAACLAFYSVSARPLVGHYSPYRLNALLTLVASAGFLTLAAPQLSSENWSQIQFLAWAAFFFAIFPAYVLANVMWLTVIRRIGAARGSVYVNLAPFVGAGAAVILLSETLTYLQALGGCVIAMAIVVAETPRMPVVALRQA
jgi:drug/metabolite transporter (DMT)-like permease